MNFVANLRLKICDRAIASISIKMSQSFGLRQSHGKETSISSGYVHALLRVWRYHHVDGGCTRQFRRLILVNGRWRVGCYLPRGGARDFVGSCEEDSRQAG